MADSGEVAPETQSATTHFVPVAAPVAATSLPNQHTHYPGLDTLRAVAIMMVIPFHAWLILGGGFMGSTAKSIAQHGWAGVELFFVLSGFLICTQLVQAVKRDGRVNFRRFYLKRTLRILPSYYAVIILYLVWPGFREKPEFDSVWRFWLFLMNYNPKARAFSHAWSLCVEEHFYLIFPSVVALCGWRPKLFRPAILICAVLLVEPALRYFLWHTKAPFFPAVYRPSHTHLDGLTVGITLALLRESHSSWWSRLIARPWLLFVGGVMRRPQ